MGYRDGSWTTNKDKNGKTVSYRLRKCYGVKPNGTTNVKSFIGKTKAAAHEKMMAYEVKQGLAPQSVIRRQTFREYFKNWIEGTLKNKIGENTYQTYQATLKNRLQEFTLGRLQVGQVNFKALQQYIDELCCDGREYSVATVKKSYYQVCDCMKVAFANGDIPKFDIDGIRLPKGARDEGCVHSLNAEDYQKFLTESARLYSTGKPHYPYGDELRFLVYCGLRVGEACALTWSDFDAKTHKLTIIKTVTTKKDDESKKNKIQISSPKTKSGIRTIILNSKAVACLERIAEKNKAVNNPNNLIFVTKNGKYLDRGNLARSLTSILKNAGCETKKAGPHVLRHTFATVSIAASAPIPYVSKYLGHAKISTTMDYYCSGNDMFHEQGLSALERI